MSWLDFFVGLAILVFRIEGAIVFWASREIPFWQNLSLVICWTSLTMAVKYYGVGRIVEKIRDEKIREWILKIRKSNFQKGSRSFSKKLMSWLFSQKWWILLFFSFLPYTHLLPGLGSTVIVTVRLLQIKYGILILALGNVFRWSVLVYHIYQVLAVL